MALIPRLFPSRNRQHLLSLVERISARVQNTVWQRVENRVASMGLHEARGYVRARAALVIGRELAHVRTEERPLAAAHWMVVERTVRHRIVRRMLLESLRRKEAGDPRRRRAA